MTTKYRIVKEVFGKTVVSETCYDSKKDADKRADDINHRYGKRAKARAVPDYLVHIKKR